MVRFVTGLIGTYFVAFAATSLVVANDRGAVVDRARPAAAKSDRLAMHGEIRRPRRIAEVELIGVDDVTVILRDGEGREVYRVDHASNLTVAARGTVLPQLRLHAEVLDGTKPDIREPAPELRRLPDEVPEEGAPEEAGEEQVFACESGLSALADRKAAFLPRVCLANYGGDGKGLELPAFASAAVAVQ